MRTRSILLTAMLALACAAPASAAGPARSAAAGYAARTYVSESGRHRVFRLEGAAQSVQAGDGSTITAWHIGLADAGDGSGEAVLLFRDGGFLGWASDRLAVHVRLSHAGTAIKVGYGVYSGNDAFCCPHAQRTVHYRWSGSRITTDATPPLVFGKKGSKLHLQS